VAHSEVGLLVIGQSGTLPHMSPQYLCRAVTMQAPLAIRPSRLLQALISACNISRGVLRVGAGGLGECCGAGDGAGAGAGVGVVCTCADGAGVVARLG